nr:SLBB domain-containing protein [uncultured Carboxylicivirga sp.]
MHKTISFKMRYLLGGLLIILACIKSDFTVAQNTNVTNINVNELSDDQITKIVDEISKRGLSDQEAIAIARMRGASSSQISQMMERIQEARLQMSSGTSDTQFAKSNDSLELKQNLDLSVKEEIQPNNLDETFGYSLFNSKNLTFEPSINLPTPKDYTMGIGDVVVITVWGASQATYQLPVATDGAINIPDIGSVKIYGQTFEAVSNKIKARLVNIYSGMSGEHPNTFAEVSLGALRSIKINVVGEVNLPGTYTVPATASAYNALYLSGGPNEHGSFRNIQVIRDGKCVQIIDVYNFLLNGDIDDNINLKENDIIYVSSYINKVRLSGSFKRTGLYETLPESTLSEVIKLAGGFKENAFHKNITIIRKTSSELKVCDVAENDFDSFVLQNGDEITSGELLDRFENRVTVNGSVYRPGSYQLIDGMMLSDLINKAEGVTQDVYLNRAIITRLNEDGTYKNISFSLKDVLDQKWDIALQREDFVTIRSIYDMKEEEYIAIEGFVNQPGQFTYASDLTLVDAIFIAGGFLNDADINEIEISRRLSFDEGQQYTNQLGHIYTFDVNRDLKLSRAAEDFKILPFDVINVRKAPGIREGGTVKLDGEIMQAGSYSLDNRQERISDLIKRAGGLTPLAFTQGAMLQREIKLSEQEKHQREMMIEKDSLVGLTMEPYEQVGIRLDKILARPGGPDDLLLAAGDKIFIPRQMGTVKISGNVMNPISMTYKAGKRAKFFIKQAGGFDARPKRNSVYVVSANGISETTHTYLFFKRYPKVEPGSEIMVPQKPESTMGVGQWVAIGSAISGLAISITSLANILKN